MTKVRDGRADPTITVALAEVNGPLEAYVDMAFALGEHGRSGYLCGRRGAA
ncbi:MAG: hypothetical protein U0235_30965 [Polyangiaceae bacterium]